MDDSRSDAGPASSAAHAREDPAIRAAAEAENVARAETRVGVLSREVGVRQAEEHEHGIGVEEPEKGVRC